jgi:hypothetical protein
MRRSRSVPIVIIEIEPAKTDEPRRDEHTQSLTVMSVDHTCQRALPKALHGAQTSIN